MQHAIRGSRWPARAWLLAAPILVVLYGCTSEKIVYRDRAPFNEPVAAAQGFLGYFSAETKQTTCGNCHADKQADWQETAHARAWSALSETSAESCKGCHSVGENGNAVSGPAGYAATHDSIYHDVQCESCHGPGLEHVTGVVNANLIRPLAKLTMPGDGTCADCHSGQHQPFVEEWEQSLHSEVVTSPASNTTSGCASCHDGRKALVAWGENSNYQERDNATAYQPQTCAVCHDPHGSPNSKQLRFAINTPDPEQNLCMKCHMRRNEPSVTSSSPHAPQGAVLLGTAGYRPAGFTYAEGRIFSSHATDANPRLCAGCHVNGFQVTDPSGNFVARATGHLFRPIPCVDAQGIPNGDKTCTYTTTTRNWSSCAKSGCHNSASVAAAAFNTVRARMKLLADELWIDTDGSHSMQAAPIDAGLLPTVRQTRATEWSNTDNKITPAEGAEFNARLCGEYGQGNTDNSKGIHNPFLCEALLIATINEVRTYYNLPAASPAVQAILNGPVGGPFADNLKYSGIQIRGYEVKSSSRR